MRKFSTIVLIFTSVLSYGQTETSPEIVAQECFSLYKQGKLDSITVRVSFFKNAFNNINSYRSFYTKLDTSVFHDGYFAVGYSILDPFFEFHGLRVGTWTYYYPSGIIYSKGEFSLGAFTDCRGQAPAIFGYDFKSGKWEYWYDNGTIMATGRYNVRKRAIDTKCGPDTLIQQQMISNWNFYNKKGRLRRHDNDIPRIINNGH
jgi:hypothetical protein